MSVEILTLSCPFCWETFEVEVQPGLSGTSWIQDCEVCCNPIQIELRNPTGDRMEAEVSSGNG